MARKITKLSKFVLAGGFLLGLVMSLAVGMMARDHNPQMEYTLNPENLVILCLVAFSVVFLPCAIFVVLREMICRARYKMRAE